LIPYVAVLQQGSPAVDKRGSSYIPDAKPGDFWLRGLLDPIRDGEKGFEAIFCGMVRVWSEFLPNRQGFVTSHMEPPADLESRRTSEGGIEKIIWVRTSNGHVVQDTRQLFILVEARPHVLPCYSTKHKFAKALTTHQHQILHPETGGIMPSYACKYRLTTFPDGNAKGKFFSLKFENLGLVSDPEYDAAEAFANSVESGALRVMVPLAGDND
jgi:hypothetical protein